MHGGKMKKICITTLILILLISSFCIAGCAEKEPFELDISQMKLTFEDNFDGDSLDRSKWNYGFDVEEGKKSAPRRGGFWAQDGVIVDGGNLILRTDWREDGENGAGWYSGTAMTCRQEGQDKHLFSQKYGYFEMRCKVPFFIGGWGAFWLMPYDDFAHEHNNQTAPEHLNTGVDGTEIDVFESPFSYLGKSKNNVINHAVHYDGYKDYLKTASKVDVKVNNLYDEYHTYGFEWREDCYKFYVDGYLTWQINSDHYIDKKGKKVKHNIVSQVEEYMLLSFEVEKEDGWCGDPAKNDKSKNYDFVIDYVRVYQFK